MNTITPSERQHEAGSDHAPFALRGANNDREWYCIVAGGTARRAVRRARW